VPRHDPLREHCSKIPAVLALQGFEKVDAFLQARRLRRINVEVLRIIRKGSLQLLKFHHRVLEALRALADARIEFFQIPHQALHLDEVGQYPRLIRAQRGRSGTRQLDLARRIARAAIAVGDLIFLLRLQVRGIDFRDLMA
jgi:hypothetical protein